MITQSHSDHELLGAVLYLLCDDLRSSIQSLEQKGGGHRLHRRAMPRSS